jgi:hypothetical protein
VNNSIRHSESYFWNIARALGLNIPLAWLQNRLKKPSTYPYRSDQEYTVDENGYNQWSLYRSIRPRLEVFKTKIDTLTYDAKTRRFQAISGLCAIDQLKVPKSPQVLLVGYREDTYDAQALLQFGFLPKVDYLDLNPVPHSEILGVDSFDSFSILKQDAKLFFKDIAENAYDLIYFSRDCLDVFYWKDALKVLEDAQRCASVGVIAHIQSIFWARNMEDGETQPESDWLVLDLLGDKVMGEQLGATVSEHLLTYAVQAGSKKILKLFSDSDTNTELIQMMTNLHSDGRQRIFLLKDLPGDPELCSVQLEGSPLSPKQSYYMSSVLLWRTR